MYVTQYYDSFLDVATCEINLKWKLLIILIDCLLTTGFLYYNFH